MPTPAQTEALPVNGWIMEIDGGALTSPHFHKLSGFSRKTGLLEVIDGGTNRKLFFTDGILEHGPLTLTRTRDKSPDDQAFANFIKNVAATGAKLNGQLTQFRFGVEVLRIQFTGMLMNEYAMSDFDTHGTDKSDQTYTCPTDFYEDTHIAA